MIQYNLIEKINAIFQSNTAIEAALLIGSFGRKTPKAHSDMDYQILVNSEFDNDKLFENLQLALNDTLKHHIYLPERRKWCLFLTEDYYVADIFICSELRQLDVHFLGSEIVHPENVLVFDKTNTVLPHVTHIIEEKQQNLSAIQQKTAETLILKFQYRFESMSAAHARSDGYKFSVVFSNALNALVRLIYLVQSDGKYEFMPPNFLTDYGYRLQLDVENLGTADLRLANKHKRKLLDLFSRYLPLVCQKYPLSINQLDILFFLEKIYERDYFWNFRDAAKFNPHFAKGIIYRTTTLTNYQHEPFFIDFLNKYKINQIIDLRAEREITESSYTPENQQFLSYVKAPFDPWTQSIAFQNTYNTGTNAEIAYHFFMVECKPSIKIVIESIIKNDHATAIHCHAGKDRTGIVIALLSLLIQTPKPIILLDYLASEMDSNAQLMAIVFNEVEKTGGIEQYLLSCDLTENQIEKLKIKIGK